MKKSLNLAAILAGLALATSAMPAETVHLTLKANGVDVQGESTVTSMNRMNTIQCLLFENKVSTAREAASGMATGRRTYEPIRIIKRIDKSSPLLAKALAMNEVVEGTFRFYRPSPGDGTTQHYYTVTIRQGRLASIRTISPETYVPATANLAAMEEVTFVFSSITWTYEPTGATHTDDNRVNRLGEGVAAPIRTVRPPLHLYLFPGLRLEI